MVHYVLKAFASGGYKLRGGGGRSGTMAGGPPGYFFWVLFKRSIPEPDPHRKDIMQRGSLCTDMLLELMNSSYT